MLFRKKICLAMIAAICVSGAYADTCKATNEDQPFRQAVLYFKHSVRCDYGTNPFDFNHSYVIKGDFEAVSGYWRGAAEPFLIYCRGNHDECVFEQKQ